jgi:L,D-peptidoglycan transpeptidase YkuD (ErfK/YbiS/YcfS/YnhG family)
MEGFVLFAYSSAGRPRIRGRLALLVSAVGLLAGVTACGTPPGDTNSALGAAAPAAATPAPATPTPSPTPTATTIAGLGPKTLARIPAGTRQVVVATGDAADSSDTTVMLWTADAEGHWTSDGTPWPAHNARDGWTSDHHMGDLHSPIGVFTLSDAGGLLANPGTKLPYHQSESFSVGGTGFEGEPLAGAFDYVVAIDYNRVPGRSPLDEAHPMGAGRGGGIWLHVDHGGPTHGCVALAKPDLVALMRALDPADHPVIVMGPRDDLAQ